MKLTTVLLDLDGVIRHFDPARVQMIEAKHGLEPGLLMRTAFSKECLLPAITGQITRQAWTDEVSRLVGNASAATEWLANRGQVDPVMLELVDELRSGGTTVAILTNGTSTIPEEMQELGLAPHFDAIFNTAEIGYAKPDVRAFQAVCDDLQVSPTTVFFTDDSPSKLGGAVELGMTTEVFISADKLRETLISLGLLNRDAS